jgi:hypothetical protein
VIPRWLRRLGGQLPFLLVLALLAAAFVYLAVTDGHWRRGTGGVALSLLVAGVLRLVLPNARAGLLALRGRWLDTVCYLGLGGLILAVAIRLR